MRKVLLASISLLSLATTSWSLFQPHALNGDQQFEILQNGAANDLFKLNAFDQLLGNLGSDCTSLDLLNLLAASSECQQAIGYVLYHILESPHPFEERYGSIAAANIEGYNSTIIYPLSMELQLTLLFGLSTGIYSGGLTKACYEIRSLINMGADLLTGMNDFVTHPFSLVLKLSAVHEGLLAKMDTFIKINCPANIGATGSDL
ncbi:hypothetical protein C8R44DRAFT_885007 [Mycena epipterygia]|nr:hypothetical protein C8R44DRAFT_885007 [Mycena epipterygia]